MWGAVEQELCFNPSAQAGQIPFPTQRGLCPVAKRLPLGLQACEGLSEPHPQQEQPRTLRCLAWLDWHGEPWLEEAAQRKVGTVDAG